MTKTATPYGFWPSDWTAEHAASASCDFAELRAGHGGVFWVQYDPADARSTLWYWHARGLRRLTLLAFPLRSGLHSRLHTPFADCFDRRKQ
jgi:hypothetical protein